MDETVKTYNFEDVKTIPTKTMQKSSAYEEILEAFLAQPKKQVKVTYKDKSGAYLASQLSKRIQKNEALWVQVKVTSISGECYLIKI